jgi:hypothetical protein
MVRFHTREPVFQKEREMSTHSTDGREWARLSTAKAGDKLIADSGFTCIDDGAELEVMQDDKRGGVLFVRCRKGCHDLDGQLSEEDGDHLVGFWPAAVA